MRVAIIGAGFSGMLAAYLLEKEGAEVTVYEKEESIGGHCRTLGQKDGILELGTVFSFSSSIKGLLRELGVAYSERFTYRNFLDDQFLKVEHLSRHEVARLTDELQRLEHILSSYSWCFECHQYNLFHEDLCLPLSDFLHKHQLHTISTVLAPHLSSFGFGSVDQTQAYYAFSIFSVETMKSFIRGDKLLFIDKGFSEVIRKLGQNISDIRYAIAVTNVESMGSQVKVETAYGSDFYDKVLITTKLPNNVIKDHLYNDMMQHIDTHPYVTCAYEVAHKNLVTTYYKSHLGQGGKIQFFHTFRGGSHQQSKGKTYLVAYAYGRVTVDLVNGITADLERAGIQVKHLITAKQWFIFPHLRGANLTPDFYQRIQDHQQESNICLIGSLVSKPALSNLYESVSESVRAFMGTRS